MTCLSIESERSMTQQIDLHVDVHKTETLASKLTPG